MRSQGAIQDEWSIAEVRPIDHRPCRRRRESHLNAGASACLWTMQSLSAGDLHRQTPPSKPHFHYRLQEAGWHPKGPCDVTIRSLNGGTSGGTSGGLGQLQLTSASVFEIIPQICSDPKIRSGKNNQIKSNTVQLCF